MRRNIPLFLFTIALLFATNAKSQFREIYNGGNVNDDITGTVFLNASTGFVSFINTVGFTQDSGHTYTMRAITAGNVNFNGYSVNLTAGFISSGVAAFTQDSVFAFGHYSAEPSILFSANQGQTWKLVYHDFLSSSNPDIYNKIFQLEFPGNTNIGAAIQHDKVLRSINRGQSWSLSAYASNAENMNFGSSATGFVSGSNYILKTINGGSTWTVCNTPSTNSTYDYNNIFFINSTNGYVTENITSTIYHTNDGGNSWTKMNDETVVPLPTSCSDLYFVNDSTGFLCKEFLYQVYRTTDSGKNWEPCKKNTDYQYLGYGFNRLQFLNEQLGWAAGAGQYLMLTTNGGPTIPKAIFKIDTTGYYGTNTVKLLNYSRTIYQYKWFKNDTLIATTYNASYTRGIFPLKDTIKLVVSNGIDSDTAILIQYFALPPPSPVITSVNPLFGGGMSSINIHGNNFTGVTVVSFGGAPAFYFNIVNSTLITAMVGLNGASGDVFVAKPGAPAGTYPGFVYLPVPTITSCSSWAAQPGSTVSITGTNFNPSPAGNTVYFGSAKANVLTATTTNLTVKVPQGAAYSPIYVNPNSLTAISPKPFDANLPQSILNASTYASRTDIAAGVFPRAVATGDFDLDGKQDIVAVNRNGNSVYIYRNTGSGNNISFAAPVVVTYSTYNKPVRVIAADVDGDGKLDILCTNLTEFGITIFLNTSMAGNMSFANYTTFTTSSAIHFDNAESVAMDDFDGDGKLDFIVANLYDQNIRICLNRSYPGFLNFQQYGISLGGQTPYSIAVKDIDGDAKPDIIVGRNGFITVYKNSFNRPTNTFFTPTAVDFAGPVNPKQLSITDLNNDGKQDIIVTDYDNGKIFVYTNQSVPGTVSLSAHTDFNCGINPASTSVVDLDGDAKPDIVISNMGSNSVSVLRNTSAGAISFDPKIDYSTGLAPEGIAVVDLNNDNEPEIITANTLSNNISILKNNASYPDICVGATSITLPSNNFSGTVYQWQMDTGSGFNNISDNADHTGTNTPSLHLNNMNANWYNYKFRCVVDAVAGQTFTIKFVDVWVGSVSNAWENPANWNCGVVPQSTTDVIINSGTVVVSANTTIGSLSVSPDVNMTVQNGVNITLVH